MMIWLLSATAISIHAKSISFDSADDELASELCQDYFRYLSFLFNSCTSISLHHCPICLVQGIPQCRRSKFSYKWSYQQWPRRKCKYVIKNLFLSTFLSLISKNLDKKRTCQSWCWRHFLVTFIQIDEQLEICHQYLLWPTSVINMAT